MAANDVKTDDDSNWFEKECRQSLCVWLLRHRPSAVFAETITYLIFMQLLTAVFPKTSFAIHDDIRTGNIARLLLRPVPLLTHYFWESVGYSFGKLIFIGIPDVILLVAVRQSALAWQTLPLLVMAVMLGYVLYFELEAIIGLFSFYTYSIWGINTFKAAVLLAVSGNVFPVNFYPAAVKTIAQFCHFNTRSVRLVSCYHSSRLPTFGRHCSCRASILPRYLVSITCS